MFVRFVIFLTIWLVTGGITGVVMARQGYDRRAWIALGLAFGPFAILLAREDVRRAIQLRPHELHRGRAGPGEVDVLAGLDGSEEAREALARAIGLLGDRIGRLTLATVIDADSAAAGDEDAAVLELARAEGAIDERDPSTVVLSGRPAEALTRYCGETDHDLLVVGRRGRGASRLVLGSVATTLARTCNVPVLIGGGAEVAPPEEQRRATAGSAA